MTPLAPVPQTPPGSATTAAKLNATYLAQCPLPEAGYEADKESRGHVLVIGGNHQMPGAALLAATAALRAGAGKLTVATAERIAPGLALVLPEARVIGLLETPRGGLVWNDGLATLADKVAAVVVGPGFLDEESSAEFVAALLPVFSQSVVVLDAMAMVGGLQRPAEPRQPIVLTPHAGEMAHLTGWSKEDIAADPLACARHGAKAWDATLVLKGADTVIALPDGRAWVHHGGTPGLATSGSGDTLAGLLGGLAARGASALDASLWAVVLHAQAGERLTQRHGALGFLAREIAGEVPAVLHALCPTPALPLNIDERNSSS
jgi:ADP-dependent NAD(P)H-hydrate dehydratase